MEGEPGLGKAVSGLHQEAAGSSRPFPGGTPPPLTIFTPPRPEKAAVSTDRQRGNPKQELRLPCLRLDVFLPASRR